MSSNRYIFLPQSGFTFSAPTDQSGHGMSGFKAHEEPPPDVDVDERIGDHGPWIATMDPQEARVQKQQLHDYRVVPVCKYRLALRPMLRASKVALNAKTGVRTQYALVIRETHSGRPISDANVIAIVDKDSGAGVRRKTGASGQCTITLRGDGQLDQLFVYPPPGYWGRYLENYELTGKNEVRLETVDPDSSTGFLASLVGDRPQSTGQGVKVGVVDTGIATDHPELRVLGGANFTDGHSEMSDDFNDRIGHGTHVAGIIAGRRTGLAPAAELMSYRVFPHDGGSASNVAVAKAIDRAVQDRCDLINLSLGGGRRDELLNEAIGHAFERGTVCIVAAGNAKRSPVEYPAWIKRCLAVSALGKTGTFPEGSVEESDIADPRCGIDSSIFVAGFSNFGREIDFCAPGVGIVSTWPGNGHAVESGTSMACPAVAGVAAALLSRAPKILNSDRDIRRSLAIVNLLQANVSHRGLPPSYGGFGMPKA